MPRIPFVPNAEVFYEMNYGPHPWWDEKKGARPDAWILWRVTAGSMGVDRREEPVAIFNFDSEGRMFMDFIIAAGLEEKLVRPPWQYVRDIKALADQRTKP